MNKLTTIFARLASKLRPAAPTPTNPSATPVERAPLAPPRRPGRPQTPLQAYRQAAESVGPAALRRAIIADSLGSSRYPEPSFAETQAAVKADKSQVREAVNQLQEVLQNLHLPPRQTTLAAVRGAEPIQKQINQLRTLVSQISSRLETDYQVSPTHKEMVVRGHKMVAALKGGEVGHFFMAESTPVEYTAAELAARMAQQAQTPAVSDEANILKPESYVYRYRKVDLTGVPLKLKSTPAYPHLVDYDGSTKPLSEDLLGELVAVHKAKQAE